MPPSYKGTFVGQCVKTSSNVVEVKVSWEDRETGELRFGKKNVIKPVYYIWNGSKWLLKGANHG